MLRIKTIADRVYDGSNHVLPKTKLGQCSACIYNPPDWVLGTGIWNDTGFWDDDAYWND